jgi:DNA-binding MarR family transcriptional regulator
MPLTTRPTRTIYLLRTITLTVRAELDRRLKPFGLAAIPYTIMSILARHEGLSSADLARRFLVTPQTMNTIILSLERKGFVAREADAANRRVLRANVTRKGISVLKRCERRVDSMEADLLRGISAPALKTFRATLRLIGTRFPRNGRG